MAIHKNMKRFLVPFLLLWLLVFLRPHPHLGRGPDVVGFAQSVKELLGS